MYILALVLLALLLAGFAWVRLAPDDAARWHVPSGQTALGEASQANSHVHREMAGRPRFEALDAEIRRTPRTQVLAGSLAEGRITYVTRSRMIGFPDYTTLSLEETAEGPVLELYGRARYGRSDLGVNRARIEGWLAAV